MYTLHIQAVRGGSSGHILGQVHISKDRANIVDIIWCDGDDISLV